MQEQFFREARVVSQNSTCVKTKTGANYELCGPVYAGSETKDRYAKGGLN